MGPPVSGGRMYPVRVTGPGGIGGAAVSGAQPRSTSRGGCPGRSSGTTICEPNSAPVAGPAHLGAVARLQVRPKNPGDLDLFKGGGLGSVWGSPARLRHDRSRPADPLSSAAAGSATPPSESVRASIAMAVNAGQISRRAADCLLGDVWEAAEVDADEEEQPTRRRRNANTRRRLRSRSDVAGVNSPPAGAEPADDQGRWFPR